MPYPFGRVSKAEMASIRAKIKAKRARNASKQADTVALMRQANGDGPPVVDLEQKMPWAAKRAKPRKSKPRRKKSLFVRLRDALDKEAQSYAAKRDEGIGCRIRKAAQCTGKSEIGYHLIPRGKWAIRWDLDFQGIGNIVGACSPCNSGERWHRLDYAEIHRQRFGTDFYDALWLKANDPGYVKHTSTGMQAMLDRIRELKAQLEAK